MRIFQLLTTAKHGDAVGNHAFALNDILKEAGYETGIFAEHIAANVKKTEVLSWERMPALTPEDIIIYHMSTGSRLNRRFIKFNCRKVMDYHNITPAEFFEGFDDTSRMLCRQGRRELQAMAGKVDYCLADSEYNRQELLDMGFDCDVDVLPIVIPFEDYEREPDADIINKYSDGRTNVLFVGRLAPNKCQEDIIRAFACYKKYYDSGARLILIGSCEEKSIYLSMLRDYVNEAGAEDVEFLSELRFPEILAFYRTASLFLCMSEHEGFCVPLLEAMAFKVPVITYGAAAVPGTMGGSGIVLGKKDPLVTAGIMDRVMKDDMLRAQIIEGQDRRLKDFSYENTRERFLTLIKAFAEKGESTR
ncbi:MAG: glycosyltransferase family 4 protein [Lachnospiraceae bacterium]|nr:glycosyltransferase family 4 protein [Lachnospiraceae bacterium]